MNFRKLDRLTAAAALALLTLCGAGVCEVSAQGGAGRIGSPEPGPRKPAAAKPAQPRTGTRRDSSRRRRAPVAEDEGEPSAPPADEGPAGRLVEEGLRHADEGEWDAAIKSYRQALAANPRHPEANIYLGDAYMGSGDYEAAFVAYKEAIRVAPSNPEAHYALGTAYNDMAMYGDAFKHFVRAIQLASNHAEAHYGIGYAYLKLENYKEALPYLKRAAAARPDFAEAHLALGLTYVGIKQTKAAEQQLKTLEALDAPLARELEREMRAAASAAAAAPPTPTAPTRTVQPPKADPTPSQDAGSRGITLGGNAETTDRQTLSPTTAQPTPENTPAVRPQRPEGGTQGAGTSSERPKRVPETSPARSQGATPSEPSMLVEMTFWNSIKDSSDPAEFEAYLKKYPKGEFAELAGLRLRALAARRGAAPDEQPARPTPEATPQPTPDPLAETLRALRKEFPNKFTYTATAPGEDASAGRVTSEVFVEYEPVQFEGCQLEWRDGKDVLSVPLADLDPLGLRVEERSRPETTYSVTVWNLSLSTVGARNVIREFKGDGTSAVNNYNGLDLQFENREKAESLARLLRTAASLCADRQKKQ